MLSYTSYFLPALLLFGCESTPPVAGNTPSVSTVLPADSSEESLTQVPEFFVYDVTMGTFGEQEQDTVVYVSLSDNYLLSEHRDSLAIPDKSRMSRAEQQHFRLPVAYRSRMLSKMGIAERDSLFLYDYARNILKAFSIKSLNAVAVLSAYETDPPFDQYSYRIGFELNKSVIAAYDPYAQYALVCIGPANPFASEGLQPMRWQAVTPKDIPRFSVDTAFKRRFGDADKKEAYRFEGPGYTYFVQNYAVEGGEKRRLLVVDQKEGKLLRDLYLEEGESHSPATLNGLDSETDSVQWAGRLFKGKPPALLGFEWATFGCTRISFLDSRATDIYISCDNRY